METERASDIREELIKLNLGCGLSAPSDWVCIDSSFTARLSRWKRLYNIVCKLASTEQVPWPKNIRILDVRKGLPFPNRSAIVIFSSHMLEHMNFEDGNFVIKESYRCLCEGGRIRIIVPDLIKITKRYLDLVNNDPKGKHSHDFLRDLNMLNNVSHKGLLKIFYRLFSHGRHKHMYDEWSLRELLEKHGFLRIEKMSYGQSRIFDIKTVEDEGRHELSVCMEGIKEFCIS